METKKGLVDLYNAYLKETGRAASVEASNLVVAHFLSEVVEELLLLKGVLVDIEDSQALLVAQGIEI